MTDNDNNLEVLKLWSDYICVQSELPIMVHQPGILGAYSNEIKTVSDGVVHNTVQEALDSLHPIMQNYSGFEKGVMFIGFVGPSELDRPRTCFIPDVPLDANVIFISMEQQPLAINNRLLEYRRLNSDNNTPPETDENFWPTKQTRNHNRPKQPAYTTLNKKRWT